MKFYELAKTFAKIETTTKRGEISSYLAGIFKKVNSSEAKVVPYLIQGRLGPPYISLDFGIDEHRISESLAKIAGKKVETIWKLYKTLGDLGLVAQEVLIEKNQPLSILQVYDNLLKIAQTIGPRSAEIKVELLSKLLLKLSKLEARFLVRIIQGKLRLGVGDATVLEALVKSNLTLVKSLGKPEIRDKIEHAYTLSSDLGLVAETLKTKGLKGIEIIGPAPGRPVLPALAQRVPTPQDAIKKIGKLIAEPKYDGLRVQLHKKDKQIWLFTRRLENITKALPSLVQAGRDQILKDAVIIDGEIVGFDPQKNKFLPFQQTARRRRKYRVEEIEFLYPVRYFVFDLLFINGQDLTSQPLVERSKLLREIIKEMPGKPIFITPQLETASSTDLKKFFEVMVDQGLEGVLVKRPDAPYHAGARLFNWIKLKRGYGALADTFDVVVVGYFKGRGKRTALGIGSLLCAVYDPQGDVFKTVSRVGSGLTDEEWKGFREKLDEVRMPRKPAQVDSLIQPDVWIEPKYVIEIIASEVSLSPRHTTGKVGKGKGYSLRFPRFSRFRFDRRPEDATTEKEIIEFFKRQFYV